MQREDVEDNYEFKVVKRLLKKEFPFVKDMRLTDGWEKYKSLLFVDIILDYDEILQHLQVEPTSDSEAWISIFKTGAPYLVLLFPPKIKKVKEEEIEAISKNISKTISRVQKSPSLPPDMKLPVPLQPSEWIPSKYVNMTKTN